MPELPEVETIRRQAQKELVGAKFAEVKFGENGNALKLRIKRPVEEILPGKQITGTTRAAKSLALEMSDDWFLLVRLLMTGRLLIRQRLENDEFLRVSFLLDDGRALNFSDRDNFADIQLLTKSEWEDFKNKYGPEPTEEDFTAEALKSRLAEFPESTIKESLVNQKVMAGLGNIHVDEVLFRAKVNPFTKPGLVSLDELNEVIKASRQEFIEATEHGGTSIDSYLDLYGKPGTHQNFFLVYSRGGQPCKNCNTPITQTELKGRRTFFCPSCQADAQLSLF